VQYAGRRKEATQREQQGEHKEKGCTRPGDALRLGDALRTDVLRYQDGRGHRDAKNRAEQQEDHDVAVVSASESCTAQELADPHRIDRAVDRLQHVAEQDG
jgi:hypothetical protein